jgi:hypothetical protein
MYLISITKNTREYGKKHKTQLAKFDKASFTVYLALLRSLVIGCGSLVPPDASNKTTSTIATFLRRKPAALCAKMRPIGDSTDRFKAFETLTQRNCAFSVELIHRLLEKLMRPRRLLHTK